MIRCSSRVVTMLCFLLGVATSAFAEAQPVTAPPTSSDRVALISIIISGASFLVAALSALFVWYQAHLLRFRFRSNPC